jgi:hypothetical protein
MSLSPALPSQSVEVPDGSVIVLRDIDAYESGFTPNVGLIVHNAASGRLCTFLTGSTWVSTNFAWRGRQVYNAGEFIEVSIGGGDWDIQLSGYELSTP